LKNSEETNMKALESDWEMMKLQTGWCLEACTKPSEASSSAEHDKRCHCQWQGYFITCMLLLQCQVLHLLSLKLCMHWELDCIVPCIIVKFSNFVLISY